MAFLDWIADWAEENIPLVGSWIAELVRKIQGAIEGAYDWVKEAVHWIEYSWIPWAETQLSSISNSLSNIWDRLLEYIEPAISALEDGFNWLVEEVENLGRDFADFISNLPVIIYENIPDWIKEGAKKALEEIGRIWNAISSLDEYITKGLNYLEDFVNEKITNLSGTIESWVIDIITPIEERLSGLESKLRDFLKDPVGYIKKVVDPILKDLSQELHEFGSWVEDKVHGFTDAILSIDDYIAKALEGFIIGLITWFIGTFIDDLAHLQYDPETKQIYGKPKNPLTHILIWFFEVEKPENPYKSVKGRMGVKE